MRTEYFLILGSLLIAPIAVVAAEIPTVQLANDQSGRLTLSEARNLVARSLLMSGERMVRIGDVTYDGGGNVIVDIVTVQGISVRHVLVDGKTHQIAAARSRRGNVG